MHYPFHAHSISTLPLEYPSMLRDVTSTTPKFGTYNSKTSVCVCLFRRKIIHARGTCTQFSKVSMSGLTTCPSSLEHMAHPAFQPLPPPLTSHPAFQPPPPHPRRPIQPFAPPHPTQLRPRLPASPILNPPFRAQESVYLGGTFKTVD